MGNGAALRGDFKEATAKYVGVQDVGLEYGPCESETLARVFVEDKADAYGSRFATGDAHRVLYFWHSVRYSALVERSLAGHGQVSG
jgi:hypothetical protein